MLIRPIDTRDAEAFSAWYEVYLAARLADHPTGPRWLEHELSVVYEGSEHHRSRLWLAGDGGRAVGAAVLGLPMRDNLTLGEPEVFVRPEARRRGIGTALLRAVEDAARTERRTSLLVYLEGPTSRSATSGTRFAEHHGFDRRITEIARVQRPPFDVEAIDAAVREAEPFAVGYEIVTWRDEVPDPYVAEFARLEARLSLDAPLGELDYEGEVWDEPRIRAAEQRRRRMRRQSWNAAAVASDGSLAGMTTIVIAVDSDDTAFQDTTIVDPVHRGHRLGLLLKAANVRAVLAERPGVRAVWTWNAETNTQMIAINETLGYRVEAWSAGYQRDL
jgi:GNAT superfamily N-acetyltransferase